MPELTAQIPVNPLLIAEDREFRPFLDLSDLKVFPESEGRFTKLSKVLNSEDYIVGSCH